MGLVGRVAIITGAGSGLGAATAEALAAQGAIAVLAGRRLHKLEQIAAAIAAIGGKAFAARTDVRSETDILQLVGQTLERFGRIDILINNAAAYEPGSVAETTADAWRLQIETNLTGPFLMTRAVLPHMRAQRYGRIVNITSALADNGAGGFAAYAASKAGLETLTRTVADEEESRHILVNLFNPGPIRTEMHATGKDPRGIAGDIVKLASLPAQGATGRLFEAGFAAAPTTPA